MATNSRRFPVFCALYYQCRAHVLFHCEWLLDFVARYFVKSAPSAVQQVVRGSVVSLNASRVVEEYLGSLHDFVLAVNDKGYTNTLDGPARNAFYRKRYNKLRRCLVPLLQQVRKNNGFFRAPPPSTSYHACRFCQQKFCVFGYQKRECRSHPPQGYICDELHKRDSHYVYEERTYANQPAGRRRSRIARHIRYTPCLELVRASDAELVDFVYWTFGWTVRVGSLDQSDHTFS